MKYFESLSAFGMLSTSQGIYFGEEGRIIFSEEKNV